MSKAKIKTNPRKGVFISEAVHRRLKVWAVSHDQDIWQVASDAISVFLDQAEEGKNAA